MREATTGGARRAHAYVRGADQTAAPDEVIDHQADLAKQVQTWSDTWAPACATPIGDLVHHAVQA